MKNGVHILANQIGRLVYELYDLADDAVRIDEPTAVEEATMR